MQRRMHEAVLDEEFLDGAHSRHYRQTPGSLSRPKISESILLKLKRVKERIGFYCVFPILTSNLSSMPEVAGEGAVLVDPYNVVDISIGIRRVLDSEDIKKDLGKKGLENIKRFSWEECAKRVLKVFERLND